jgi:hypothetical protein
MSAIILALMTQRASRLDAVEPLTPANLASQFIPIAIWLLVERDANQVDDLALPWVELRGFEPLTPSMRTRCATGLRYSPKELSLA